MSASRCEFWNRPRSSCGAWLHGASATAAPHSVPWGAGAEREAARQDAALQKGVELVPDEPGQANAGGLFSLGVIGVSIYSRRRSGGPPAAQ